MKITRWFVARHLLASVVVFAFLQIPAALAARCGGTERWFVKVGTDPDAAQVPLQAIVPTTVQALNFLPNLQPTVPHGDNKFRLTEEKVVYQVSGRLVLFKDEDDGDYHLVVTDDSLRYTPGGQGTEGLETGTSFIAEIPNPDCVPGKKGDLNVLSAWDAQLRSTRAKFEAKFPAGTGADTDLGGIPVTIVGVAFYDRPHLQTGRAINGIELHPILDIAFGSATPGVPATPPVGAAPTQLLANPGFEKGTTGWNGTVADIGSYQDEAAHSGDNFAWLGGLGTAHSESLYQHVTIPSLAQTVTLTFWLQIKTAEVTTTNPYDKLYIQIRDADGNVLRSLATVSNLDKTPGHVQKTFDISEFKGRDIQIYFRAIEDQGKATSFMLDDFALTVH